MVRMDNLTEVELGREVLVYIESCLAEQSGLCACLRRLRMDKGRGYAPLPRGTTSDRALRFDAGGLITTSSNQMRRWWSTHLQELKEQYREGTLIFQDLIAKPTDKVMSLGRVPWFAVEDNVYYFVEYGNLSVKVLDAALRSVASFDRYRSFLSQLDSCT
jgi:hypothetical protein